MAIAFDASSSKIGGNASSSTFAHTCTGSNLVLVVGVQADSAADPTGITYNSVAMTKATSILNSGIESSIWYLASPATGANNIVVTFAAAHYHNAFGISLTGCDTTSPVDGTNTGTGSTNDAAITVTTSVSGSWRVASVFHNRNSSRTAISGSTIRTDVLETTDSFRGISVTEQAGATGAVSLGETMGTASDGWWIAAMGVKAPVSGPANVKTWDGLAIASMKTLDALATGSIKTIIGLN